jgi:hypothetical protein
MGTSSEKSQELGDKAAMSAREIQRRSQFSGLTSRPERELRSAVRGEQGANRSEQPRTESLVISTPNSQRFDIHNAVLLTRTMTNSITYVSLSTDFNPIFSGAL